MAVPVVAILPTTTGVPVVSLTNMACCIEPVPAARKYIKELLGSKEIE